ncbi:MAG: ferritin [Ignavibacteriales bacterium CG18_big_fil_WC_8_21_14_2_50_31_20]|nr:MAG: ferritin [Ignavibacteriales bacterium CG18_big_fil_WC_8_21_14_2_50_31_20]
MISKKMEQALNQQLNRELFSSYLYLSMATYFESKNLIGMSKWMRLQAEEEHIHSMKLLDFIQKIGGRVILEQIDKPQIDWDSPLKVFQETLEHEEFITKHINELTDLAIEERDHSTRTFLQWYVDEQVEEEAVANEIVQKFNLIGDSKSGLYMLDQELGARIPSPNTQTKQNN